MIPLPNTFPQGEYVPHGYLDNPFHTAVLNRSGVVRSVPPTGFGYWCRSMPWAYGMGVRREVNYLSFFHPAIAIDGVCFHETEDFQREGAALVSHYHTKNLMTYDWTYRQVQVRLAYHLVGEHTLFCHVDTSNQSVEPRRISLHATHIYGYPELGWWGSDGVASRFNADAGASVAKIWAYGDVFVMRTSEHSAVFKATASRAEWRDWMVSNNLGANEGASSNTPDPVYSILSTEFEVAPGTSHSSELSLTRGVNEKWTTEASRTAHLDAPEAVRQLLSDDDAFYQSAPVLAGDWPIDWKNGWIYDLETIRMNVRRPVGIFKHHWDAMQIFAPRSVLGEAVLDAMCLSYADMDLAKDVILGTFADAPMPNVPCVREDGSMNMISMGGEECGTAPIWVLPFRTIQSVYDRDADDAWVAALYPHMEAFVQWWLDNRTDDTGRFFCNNSWESGQDGSKRFLIGEGEEGKEAEYVHTVDVEAAMADAMRVLANLARAAGRPDRAIHWGALADERVATTRAMYVDGWYRDFDSRTNTPIILPGYLDVMMLLPLSVGLAAPEHVQAIKPKFEHFVRNPKLWLEWPSFMFCFCEAGSFAGLNTEMADLVGATADRVYRRTNGPGEAPAGAHRTSMPEAYNYRIPGTANEFWPMEPAGLARCGSEAYGWGATLPTLMIRNIIGFREASGGFTLAPTLPAALRVPGKSHTITNLRYRSSRFDLTLATLAGDSLLVSLTVHDGSDALELIGPSGEVFASGSPFAWVSGEVLTGRQVEPLSTSGK